jgi:hypothetical protein
VLLAALDAGANDVVTAVLAIAVGSIVRGLWSLQARLSRLEALDEMRERRLDTGRADEEENTQDAID